jgi:antitoxin component of RelBE/YafQ-DinJ toxin-antitoxin module
MLATVSARVPVEVRNQVHQKLRNSGTTPSQFINDVYLSYLSDNLSLKQKASNKSDGITNQDVVKILKLSTCNFETPLPSSFDFKAELEEGRAKEL